MGRYVIGIDIGTSNLGLCVYDSRTAKVVCWKRCSLLQPRQNTWTFEMSVKCVRRFLTAHQQYFDDAQCVLLEKQMRGKMMAVQCMFAIQNYDTAIVVKPQHVKKQYDISKRDYKLNKQAACAWAQQFVTEMPDFFSLGCVQAYHDEAKQDDMADALLLVRFFLDTYIDGYQVSNF